MLLWVLEGKTNWEIGLVTGVPARTVQFHLGNASRKLGVVTRVQAAVRALLRGDLSAHQLSQPALKSGWSTPSHVDFPSQARIHVKVRLRRHLPANSLSRRFMHERFLL
jgi:hypothetical protein